MFNFSLVLVEEASEEDGGLDHPDLSLSSGDWTPSGGSLVSFYPDDWVMVFVDNKEAKVRKKGQKISFFKGHNFGVWTLKVRTSEVKQFKLCLLYTSDAADE